MQSHLRRENGSRGNHFFKIILPHTIQDQQLRMPVNFIARLGKELPDVAVLQTPGGKTWRVGLRKVDDEVWFHNGWQEFVDGHCIHVGYFLVFRYDGNSHFHVLIFDKTATEIEYPCETTKFEDSQEANSLETTFDLFPTCQTPKEQQKKVQGSDNLQSPPRRAACLSASKGLRNKKSRLNKEKGTNVTSLKNSISKPDLIPRNKRKRNEEQEAKREPGEKQKKTKGGSNFQLRRHLGRRTAQSNGLTKLERNYETGLGSNKKKLKGIEPNDEKDLSIKEEYMDRTISKPYDNLCASRRMPLTTQEKARVNQATRMLKSINPIFRVIMRVSYLQKGFALNIPINFAKIYMSKEVYSVTLSVSDGRTWSANYSYAETTAKLCKGWSLFAHENNLKKGDICFFELIKEGDIELKVSIFRADP